MDPVYGYQAQNVEAELLDESSLLRWMRRFLAIRRQWPAFGSGDFEVQHPTNRAILAYTRSMDDSTILCVHNLSKAPQPVELDLSPYSGRTPVELSGNTRFPSIGELPYLVTLAGYGFYWFSLERPE